MFLFLFFFLLISLIIPLPDKMEEKKYSFLSFVRGRKKRRNRSERKTEQNKRKNRTGNWIATLLFRHYFFFFFLTSFLSSSSFLLLDSAVWVTEIWEDYYTYVHVGRGRKEKPRNTRRCGKDFIISNWPDLI